MKQQKLWTKDFVIVSVVNFFLYFTFYLLVATITVYATEQFHAAPSEAGLASGIFVLGALISRLFSGRSIERVGRKKLLYIGFIFLFFTTLFYFFVHSLWFLFINRFLHGAAFGIATTATGTIVANIIPDERRGEGTGYYALSTTLAAAFGPFLGMFVHHHAGFAVNFVLCALLLSVSFLASIFLYVPKAELSAEELKQMKEFTFGSFFEQNALPIAAISAVIGLAYSSILSFLNSYAMERHFVDAASFFFVVYAFTVLASRPFTGRWFDEKGENFVMYPAFILFAVGLVILSLVHQGYLLLIAGIFVGLGYGTYMSSAQAIAIKVSPSHRMGLATSTFFIFVDLGVGVGPFLLGFIIPSAGYNGLYELMGAVVFACIFLYYALHGKKTMRAKKVVHAEQ